MMNEKKKKAKPSKISQKENKAQTFINTALKLDQNTKQTDFYDLMCDVVFGKGFTQDHLDQISSKFTFLNGVSVRNFKFNIWKHKTRKSKEFEAKQDLQKKREIKAVQKMNSSPKLYLSSREQEMLSTAKEFMIDSVIRARHVDSFRDKFILHALQHLDVAEDQKKQNVDQFFQDYLDEMKAQFISKEILFNPELTVSEENSEIGYEDLQPLDRLHAIFEMSSEQIDQTKNKADVIGEKIYELCSQLDVKLIQGLKFTDQCKITMENLVLSNFFPPNGQSYTEESLCLLIRSGNLHLFDSFTEAFTNELLQNKKIPDKKVVISAMVKMYGINEQSVAQIFANFKLLAHQDLLPHLKNHSFQNQILEILIRFNYQQSPYQILLDIENQIGQKYWVWDCLTVSKINQPKAALEEVSESMKLLDQFTKDSFSNAVREKGVENLRQVKQFEATQQKGLVQQDQQKLQEKVNQLIENLKIKDTYDRIRDRCSQIQTQRFQFSVNIIQIYYSALAVSSQKAVVLLTTPPGNGKTFAALQIADDILNNEHKHDRVVYVALNSYLESQINEEIADKFVQNQKVTVMDIEKIDQIDQSGKTVYIIDEFYHCIIEKMPIQFNEKGSLSGPICLLNAPKLFLLSATDNPCFVNFLSQIFPDFEHQQHEKMANVVEDQVKDNISFRCDPDLAKLRNDLIQQAVAKAQVMPVIIFGLCDRYEQIKQSKNIGIKDIQIQLIELDEELIDFRRYAVQIKSHCIVLLSDQFAIGTDLRFQQDAYVFYLSCDIPSFETHIQKIGRSCRSLLQQQGRGYICCKKEFEAHIVKKMREKTKPNSWIDAAKNIDMLRRAEALTKPQRTTLLNAMQHSLFSDQDATIQKMGTTIFQKLSQAKPKSPAKSLCVDQKKD